MSEKKCVRCNEMKPLSEFGRRSKSVDGLQFRCRNCKAEVGIEERRVHGPKWLANQRARYWAFDREAKIARNKERMKDPQAYAKKANLRGLHVPWNLRVVTAFENMSKHNKLMVT